MALCSSSARLLFLFGINNGGRLPHSSFFGGGFGGEAPRVMLNKSARNCGGARGVRPPSSFLKKGGRSPHSFFSLFSFRTFFFGAVFFSFVVCFFFLSAFGVFSFCVVLFCRTHVVFFFGVWWVVIGSSSIFD